MSAAAFIMAAMPYEDLVLMRLKVLLALALSVAGCSDDRARHSRHLFVWAGDADKQESDFVAVVDADPESATYADVVSTLPVGVANTMAHHTDYVMPSDGVLWANGYAPGLTFRFDLRDPAGPRLAGSFGNAGRFSHPHSFVRLPSGNILATFQQRAGQPQATGGLVELDSAGRVLRHGSAAVPEIDSTVRPYSLAVVPALDRVVTTATDMRLKVRSRAVQVWRLSDLKLLHTLLLPRGPRGDENWLTAEPRVLADGRTVLVNTFTCALYRLRGLDSDEPRAEWVYSTPWKEGQPYCAVPAIAGHFWLQTSGAQHAVLTLDVSDPARPREVSRLQLKLGQVPHWIGLEPSGNRLVITGYRALAHSVLLGNVDRTTGSLAIDTTVDFGRDRWPHGSTGPAVPHGAVFGLP